LFLGLAFPTTVTCLVCLMFFCFKSLNSIFYVNFVLALFLESRCVR
jgi:hypothetical protein